MSATNGHGGRDAGAGAVVVSAARPVALVRYRPRVGGKTVHAVHVVPLPVDGQVGVVDAVCGAALLLDDIETVTPGEGMTDRPRSGNRVVVRVWASGPGMNAHGYQTSYSALRAVLKRFLLAKVASSGSAGGCGRVGCGAGAALDSLLAAHPVDRRGRCRSW